MTRRTYSCLAIARRHPRLFSAMHAPLGHFTAVPGSASQAFHWPQVAWRTADEPRRRRVDPPRASRFADLLGEA